MGKPSDKKRAALRPGKRERAQTKKRTTFGHGVKRSGLWSSAWGAGTVMVYLGPKKMGAAMRSRRDHQAVEPITPNVGAKT